MNTVYTKDSLQSLYSAEARARKEQKRQENEKKIRQMVDEKILEFFLNSLKSLEETAANGETEYIIPVCPHHFPYIEGVSKGDYNSIAYKLEKCIEFSKKKFPDSKISVKSIYLPNEKSPFGHTQEELQRYYKRTGLLNISNGYGEYLSISISWSS